MPFAQLLQVQQALTTTPTTLKNVALTLDIQGCTTDNFTKLIRCCFHCVFSCIFWTNFNNQKHTFAILIQHLIVWGWFDFHTINKPRHLWGCIGINLALKPAYNEIIKILKSVINVKSVHYENTPIQIYRKFHLQKLKIFK